MSNLLISGPFVAYLPSLGRLLGNVESAIILQHLHFKAQVIEGGGVPVTRQEISDETGINFATVTRRLSQLREASLITSERSSRSDSTQVYYVCHDQLEWLLSRE